MATGTLVDTNVLLDVLTEDPAWQTWSSTALASAFETGTVFVNPLIYAEVSIRFSRIEELDAALPATEFVRAPLPWDAAFLAGKAHLGYRRSGGSKTSTLPDFFIGAHAAVADLTLLTRDAGRYRTYFPTIRLITPDP